MKANPDNPSEQAARWCFSADEQHVIARLEGFTDVIFGFVIFMLATNMKVPADELELVNQRYEFLIFFANFAFVAALWWQQHRIFANYFRPTTLSIVILFAFLGCTALLSYPLQLYFQEINSRRVIQTYLVGFAVVYLLQTLLIQLGRWNLRNVLSADRQWRGRVFAAISGALGLTGLLAFILTLFIGPGGAVLMFLIPVVVPVARLISRRVGPPISIPQPGPESP